MKKCVVSLWTVILCVCGGSVSALTLDIVPGPVGGPADFDTGSAMIPVDANGVAEVWVDFDPYRIAASMDTAPFEYTASFRWDVASPNAVLSFEGVSDVNDSPLNFADAGIDTSVSAGDNSINRAFVFPAFPFDVAGYHATIEGLSPGDMVTFQKVGMGGLVIPEPTAASLAMFVGCALALIRRRSGASR